MKPFFTREDFDEYLSTHLQIIVDIANTKLQKLIDEAPVFYGSKADGTTWTNTPWESDKVKARLMFIEPIVKEECKHELDVNDVNPSITRGTCKHCGVELKAEWKEVK